jgi:DNA-binding NarL/FixJ family response regulator
MARILIIDRCDASRELAAELLEQCDHEVLQAPNVELALKWLADSPDLALVRPAMVGPGDSALMHALRDAIVGRDLRVLTWTDAPEEVRRMSVAGACGFVPRVTGSLDLLVGKVERALLMTSPVPERSCCR